MTKKLSPRRKTLTKARDSASLSAPADAGGLRPGRGGSDSSWSWLLSSEYQLDVPAPQTGGQSVTLSVSVSHTTWAWGCPPPILTRLYFFCACSYVHCWFVVHKHYLMFLCEHVQYCKKKKKNPISEWFMGKIMSAYLERWMYCCIWGVTVTFFLEWPENCSSQQSSPRTSPPAGGDFIFCK